MQTIYDAKILIVDDNQDLLNLVTTALRSTGYNQLTACTGCAAAQAAFAANRPDLMINGVGNIPRRNGCRAMPGPWCWTIMAMSSGSKTCRKS